MLIGIDANEANVEKRVGSNVYAFEVLWQMHRQDTSNQYLIYLSRPPLSDLPPAGKRWQYKILTPGTLWTQWRLPLSLYFDHPRPASPAGGPDLFLTLGHYAPRFSPVPTMVCIMDLAFLRFPDTFKARDLWQLKSWTRYSVRKASKIIAISEATKKDLMNYYGVPGNKITVAYPGVEKLTTAGISPVKGKYVLYLGTLQPRKNIDALIDAFTSISPPRCNLVIAGKIGWKYQKRAVPGVKYLGFVPQEKLGALIKGSAGLVLPSLYEGFGIPVAQAMSLKVPALVSRNSSLPEIVGNTGLYIESPFDAAAIRKGIIQILSLSGTTRQTMIKTAQTRASRFSWQSTGQIILEVINDFRS